MKLYPTLSETVPDFIDRLMSNNGTECFSVCYIMPSHPDGTPIPGLGEVITPIEFQVAVVNPFDPATQPRIIPEPSIGDSTLIGFAFLCFLIGRTTHT